MKIRVTLEQQPLDFIKRQPPETRQRLRSALHAVEEGASFPEPLEDQLEGFYKLKIRDYRLILQAVAEKDGPQFRVVFAERRKAVYEMFSQILGLE